MAGSGPQTFAGRPYSDYLRLNRKSLVAIANYFGLVRGFSGLNKEGVLEALKEHIKTLRPRPTGRQIHEAFGIAPPPRQAPPPGQGPRAPAAPPIPPAPLGQAPAVGLAPPPGQAPQAPAAPPLPPALPAVQAPAVGPAPPPQAPPAGKPPPPAQKIEVPVKKIEKPRTRPAEPNSTDIQHILRRVLKSIQQKEPEVIPPYNHGLNVDPEADDPTYTATSDAGLTVSDAQTFMAALKIAHPVGTGPEVSFVRMVSSGSPAKYRFANGNGTYRFRGRGPVWDDNSCAIDTCIVAGMFLNAGSTTADKGTETRTFWTTSLKPLQQAFLNAINIDWKSISSAESIRLRDGFLDMYVRTMNSTRSPGTTAAPLRKGLFMSAVSVWELSTMNFHQFTFLTRRFLNLCRSCGARNVLPPENVPESSVAIELKSTEIQQTPPPTFERLLRDYFGYTPIKDCSKCKAGGTRFKRRLIVGDLPPRLVVQPHPEYRHMPGYASDEVSFDYEAVDGTVRHVTYSWLGGIYLYKKHYRTYWNDSKAGDKRKLLRLYDGQHEGGIIIGGIEPRGSNPAKNDQRIIHEDWENGTDLLFYERTDNPVVESLCAVVQKALDNKQDKKGGDGNQPSGGDGGKQQPGAAGGNQPGGNGANQSGGDGGN